MARKIRKGATDISVILRAIDSTTGAPKTDFAYNTAGIDLWYRRNGATVTSITEATLAAADTAHSDGGVIHLGNGYFRLDSPDAAFATGVNSVMFGGTATGVIIIGTEIQLVNYDPEDAVRLGLTALPNANADAAGGLPISDAGGLDLDAQLATLTNGTYGLSAIETLVDDLESRLTATRAGYLDNLSEGAVALASVCTEARLAELGSANLPADIDTLISRLTALRAGYLDNLSAGAVALASGVTVTTNNDKTGYTVSTVSDKTGYALSEAGVTAVQSGLSTLTAQQVWEYTTRTLSSFGSLVADVATAVWGAVARTITGGTITTNSDKTGYSLSTAGVSAVQNGIATSAEISALNDISVADILAGQTEAGLSLQHAMQIITALALKASGGGTSSITFRNYGDTKNRITMTVDENGNRTAVTVSFD